MQIFKEIKQLVKKEKYYTIQILEKLMIVEREKLYCDLMYSSLFSYLVKELKYSEREATLKVNTVRLMLQSKKAQANVKSGKLSQTNASEISKVIKNFKTKKDKDEFIDKISDKSNREVKKIISIEFKKERTEKLVLNELVIRKFDQIRKYWGDKSSLEIILILLQKELSNAKLRHQVRKTASNSRYIPKHIKQKVYTGECANCGVQYNLEYDHIKKYSHGGLTSVENLQILCRNCNQRKEIKARQTKFFA